MQGRTKSDYLEILNKLCNAYDCPLTVAMEHAGLDKKKNRYMFYGSIVKRQIPRRGSNWFTKFFRILKALKDARRQKSIKTASLMVRYDFVSTNAFLEEIGIPLFVWKNFKSSPMYNNASVIVERQISGYTFSADLEQLPIEIVGGELDYLPYDMNIREYEAEW